MADLASIIAAAADDREAQRRAVRDTLAALMDAPQVNAFDATTADALFAALDRQNYSEGWGA